MGGQSVSPASSQKGGDNMKEGDRNRESPRPSVASLEVLLALEIRSSSSSGVALGVRGFTGCMPCACRPREGWVQARPMPPALALKYEEACLGITASATGLRGMQKKNNVAVVTIMTAYLYHTMFCNGGSYNVRGFQYKSKPWIEYGT